MNMTTYKWNSMAQTKHDHIQTMTNEDLIMNAVLQLFSLVPIRDVCKRAISDTVSVTAPSTAIDVPRRRLQRATYENEIKALRISS